jgi:hypothetical protein
MKELLWQYLGVNACYLFKKFNAWSCTVVSHCIILNTTKPFAWARKYLVSDEINICLGHGWPNMHLILQLTARLATHLDRVGR